MAASAARSTAVRRPARRKSHGRSPARGSGIRWDRVARLSLLIVLALVLLSYIGPAAEYLRAWSLAKDTRADVKMLQEDNQRLRERARQLRRLETIELEARRAGMAKPGERVYVARGLPRDP